MEKKLKEKFLLVDYIQTLFQRFQNLKQNLSPREDYTSKFNKWSICVDQLETCEQMAAKYVNGLKLSIQDELGMHRVSRMEEAYQLTLKVEEKKSRQYFQRNKGSRSTSSPSRGGYNYSWGESSQ